MRFLCILGISLVICGAGRAELSGRDTVDFHGQILGGGLSSYGSLTVQLRNETGAVKSATVFGNGDFEFASVPEGQYTAAVLDWGGNVVWEDSISVHGVGSGLTIRLPERKAAERPASGTVSVQALEHKVPKAALKEYRSGREAFEHGDYDKAAKRFEKALHEDPAFVDAYNDLAATYSHMGRHEDALNVLRKANEIDPNSATVNLNLSAALLRAKQFGEAEQASRRALELHPDLPQADVILGICLKAQNGDPDEALFHLLRGAGAYPEARLTAAEILQDKGKRNEAVQQLKKYLETNRDPKRREQVRQWMAQLQ